MKEQIPSIEISIGAVHDQSGAYGVKATLDGDDELRRVVFEGSMQLDTKKLWRLEQEYDVVAYGKELYYALFSGPIRQAYDRIVDRADEAARGSLRVLLTIDRHVAVLQAIRWEAIYHRPRMLLLPLTINVHTPFCRYVELGMSEATAVMPPIRMLFAISNPVNLNDLGLSEIEVEVEVRNIVQAIGDLRRTNQMEVTVMPGCSQGELSSKLLNELQDLGYVVVDGPTSLNGILDNLTDHHILHFLGHGTQNNSDLRDSQNEINAALLLEKDDGDKAGEADLVPHSQIVDRLAQASKPQLIFLASCDTAKRDTGISNPFVGLAPQLVEIGVPAVIAMQDKLDMDVAKKMTRAFYRELIRYGLVDRALNHAHDAIYERESFTWTIPVLYLRLASGRLFGADPVRATLEIVHHKHWLEHIPLPVEVVHLMGHQDLGNLDRIQSTELPELLVIDAINGIFEGDEEQLSESEATPASEIGDISSAHVVLLIGWRGSTKTSQLKNVARHTAKQSLMRAEMTPIIPVYINFGDFPPSLAGTSTRVEHMIKQSLRSTNPELTSQEIENWIKGEGQNVILRILLDGSDDLAVDVRRALFEDIRLFIYEHPQHEYVVAIDRRDFNASDLRQATDLLVMQPLPQRKVKEYLNEMSSTTGQQNYELLIEALEQHYLFDLAGSPWLLIKLVDRAKSGYLPRSRIEVLGAVIEDMIEDKVSSTEPDRPWAEQSLYALAWQMQNSRRAIWKEQDVFEAMRGVRLYREYDLDPMYHKLIDCGILVRVAPDSVRFAYQGIQAYCCAKAILAMPNCDEIIDDITATLGRLTRLRWWEVTLILMSGLMDDPSKLLRSIDFGVNITEGEQVFLMARCLLEDRQNRIAPELRAQVIGTLIWRLKKEHEPWTERRARSAAMLTLLCDKSAITELENVIFPREEVKPGSNYVDDDSIVRRNAARALKEMMPFHKGFMEQVLKSPLLNIINQWIGGDEQALDEHLHNTKIVSSLRAVAAFALGDLRTARAMDILYNTFLSHETEANTRWAITDALTSLDPTEVSKRAVVPLLLPSAARKQQIYETDTWINRKQWYPNLAYLIGRTRALDGVTMRFLKRCITNPEDVRVLALAIESWGLLYAGDVYREMFEDFAVAKLDDPIFDTIYMDQSDKRLVRLSAIKALANIGNHSTVKRLQASQEPWDDAEIRHAIYLTSEEIDWRLEYKPER